MKFKKVISLALVAAMGAALLAGCGSSSSETTTENTSAAETEDASAAEETAEETGFEGFDEMQNIEGYGLSFYGDTGLQEVLDGINAISESEINVHFNYHPLDVASYMEQIGLMLSGGEAFDLVLTTAIPVVSFSTMTSQNELADITDLLDEYAPDLKEMLGDYMACTTVDGRIYAVPTYKCDNSSYYMFMREDVLDYLGLTEQARNCSSWSELEEIMIAVRDAQDTLPAELQTTAVLANSDAQGSVITGTALDTGADAFADDYGYETLADSTRMIYVDEDGKVGNYFASDDYRATIERVNKWYNEGLIYKDAATSDETGDTLLKNGVVFCYGTMAEYGAEVNKEAATGYDLVALEYCAVPVQTYNVNAWTWAVPVTSENPEAAVAFMNLMYTNPDIENYFVYGVEGRDYELNDQGEAVRTADMQYQCDDFLFGNQFNAYPLEGAGATYREDSLADFQSAETSPYLGFSVNTEPIANEITSVSNVLSKYEPGLESGSSDPAVLDQMLAELESAGESTMIEFYQNALDEWLAQQ